MFPNCVLSIKKIMSYFGCFLKGTRVGMGELITNIIFAICIYDNDNNNNNIPSQQQQIIKYSPHQARAPAKGIKAKKQSPGLQSQGLEPRIKAKDQSHKKDQSQGSKPRIKAKDIIAVGQQHSINTTERRCRENRLQKRQMHKTVKECILCIDVLLSRRRCYGGVFQSTPL